LAGLAVVLVAGLWSGFIARLGFGLLSGLGFGLVAGLAVVLVAGSGRRSTAAPSRDMRISAGRFGFALVAGLVAGLIAGGRFGLSAGLAAGPALGLVAVPGDPAAAPSPQAMLARDRRAALLLMLVAGLAAGLGFGLGATLAGGLRFGLAVGLAAGFVAGLFVSWTRTAWPSYILTTGWLAFRHRLPWPLMNFLADAHERGVLRQAGAVYQFRHIDLQHRLASRP